MEKEIIIEKIVKILNMLPQDKVMKVAEFTNYLFKKHEDHKLQKGIEHIVERSQTFQFVNDDEVLYTVDDIKEKY